MTCKLHKIIAHARPFIGKESLEVHIQKYPAMSRAISSLFDCALQAVLRDLPLYEGEFPYLPSEVKTSLALIMAKRGLLTDKNIRLVDVCLDHCNAFTHFTTSRCYMMGFRN